MSPWTRVANCTYLLQAYICCSRFCQYAVALERGCVILDGVIRNLRKYQQQGAPTLVESSQSMQNLDTQPARQAITAAMSR